MKLRKRIASVVTAMVCAASICTGGYGSLIAEAETTGTYGDLTYSTVDSDGDGTDDYVKISDCDESATEVEIPEKIEGLPVASFGFMAFYNCTSLASITIPDSVTSIGWNAFEGCTSLASITIPDSVTSIGDRAFFSCTSLASINVLENNIFYSDVDGVLFNKEQVELLVYPAGKRNKEYVIPDSVTSIRACAFYGCTNLASITIPDSVTSIGFWAFKGCTSLASITIPDSVTSIGKDAFSGTALLANQTGVKYADTWVVDCDEDVTSAEIKDGTREIADFAFYGCTSLASITIPDSVTSIGDGAFYDCISLASVTIPDSVTSIGSSAFSGCTSLASITIPDSVTSIRDWTFEDCTSLASITIKNPECEIYDSEDTISYTATIYGYANSTAQAYAEKYNRTFVALDFEQPTETEPTTEPAQPTETIDYSFATKYGDANNDGTVDVADVVQLNLYLLNPTVNFLDRTALANSDCTRDGIVDSADGALILNYVAMVVSYDMLGAE